MEVSQRDIINAIFNTLKIGQFFFSFTFLRLPSHERNTNRNERHNFIIITIPTMISFWKFSITTKNGTDDGIDYEPRVKFV